MKNAQSILAKNALWILSFVTMVLWLMSKSSLKSLTASPSTSLAQIAGLIGIIALGWNLVLSARFQWLDKLFGGLDVVYKQHRRTGSLAFTLMLAHPLLLMVAAIPYWSAIRFYLLPSEVWSYNWGILALWGFTLLILATFFTKLPYHIWKQTHRLMGVPFVLVAIHVATIESDVSRYLPLRYWILGIVTVGFLAYVYKQFLYRFFGPKYKYVIDKLVNYPKITEVHLSSQGKTLDFVPGQFVFISIDDKQVGREEHPFTISSSPDEKQLRLSIKHSGDYTKRLKSLKEGVDVRLFGPYGQFGERFLVSNKNSIWIAGGIGVTPFLSLLRHSTDKIKQKQVHFYYCTRSNNEAAYHQEIHQLAKTVPGLEYSLHCSANKGRLTVNSVAKQVKDLTDQLIFLCGPKKMMHQLAREFVSVGVPQRNIIFEDFSFR